MKKKKFNILILTATLFLSQSMTVFAVTESDVQAVGKETAAGNVFIWFLCAIAFLKISQKIDSFIQPRHQRGTYRRQHDGRADGGRKGAYHCKERGRRFQLPRRLLPCGRKFKQHEPVILPLRRACRGCGEAVHPERHADHDRARE